MNPLSYGAALESLYGRVEKPGRYIGCEWNAVYKNPAEVALRLCLVFPDLYELALGNLGLQILYQLLNAQPGVWAERAYLPAPDLEALLREKKLAPPRLESQEPLNQADAIGFTLQSELTYVNILRMLDLAGLALRSEDRAEEDPLIFAGGPCAFNPEPLAPFLDFVVIGDGEEAVVEIARCLLEKKHESKVARLQALSTVEGVYVPALFPTERLADGRVLPRASAKKIRTALVRNLDDTPFPDRPITPFVQLVHDGYALEVLRGCSHGCRFCQAGMITRPVRERSMEKITGLLDRGLTHSGFEDATLVSLSTCDYSRAPSLLHAAAAVTGKHDASLSLPSLRLDRFSVTLADHVASMRRSGLTFAPEAGSQRLRRVINKDVTDEQLLELAEEVFRRGWTHIKLYFMIGLPTETDEDVKAIADLCIRTLLTSKKIRSRAQLRLGVSTFVPKAFTPFQWAAQIGLEETREKHQLLAELLRPHRAIRFGRHAPESSFIEGMLSRADRRAADLLEAVFRCGGGYETWEEKLNFSIWMDAAAEVGYPVDSLFAERPEDWRFPWDHVDATVDKEALRAEWLDALEEKATPDCRLGQCHHCGALHRAPECCAVVLKTAEYAKTEAPLPAREEVEPKIAVQRMRFRVGRSGRLRFLSHLEFAQAWIRGLRRAGAPMAYSQGFHAHPKVTFSTAMPVGEESEAEWMDVLLTEEMNPEALLNTLRGVMPEGLQVYEAATVSLKATSLMAAVRGHRYRISSPVAQDLLMQRLQALKEKETWMVDRRVKDRSSRKGKKIIQLDIRPLINCLERVEDGEGAEGWSTFIFETGLVEGRLAKVREVMALLDIEELESRVVKEQTFLEG
ncbi:MAG: TIGR03960 family B12-binding radical SAM protein [Candidatus Hydrogenedens sp.]|nr:TIGR03960 family B12-binding radical SAM protein [Candidatus Hydrogenedens sp.]